MMIESFSKLTREQKIQAAASYASRPLDFTRQMFTHWHSDISLQKIYAEFAENTVSNFYLPYGLAPNFLINDREYIVPMVTEESSVVAAAASAAKFWYTRGGFHALVEKTTKPGHIHFLWKKDSASLRNFVDQILPSLKESIASVEKSMKARGGGIHDIRLKDCTSDLPNYFQIEVQFDTVDAMGANYINSCLETMAACMNKKAEDAGIRESIEIIMSILSNYTTDCLVQCKVICNLNDFGIISGMPAKLFANRFRTAVLMAASDCSRAVTHNKGIFNGVDAVILATGNDFRAVEAAGHAWAARKGKYTSLSKVEIVNERFEFTLEIPMPVGVVGGITNIHPLAKASLELLGDPKAEDLMKITAAAGLANHFSAIRSLVTTGIQKGHMRLHLMNILEQLHANDIEKEAAFSHFKTEQVSYSSVKQFMEERREK